MRALAIVTKMRLAHFSWRFALSSTALVYAWLPSKQEYDRSASNNHDANFKSTTRFYGSDGDKSGDFSGETLETLAEKLGNQKFQNIVVLIGAGASVSAGIPDFRTPGTGLYDRLQHYQLPYPEAIFDLDYYQNQPKPFVELCQEIWPGKEGGPRPTLAHAFCKVLEDQGMLQRIYTQNIDGLEALAGIDTEKLVECHGHFRSSSCIKCRSKMQVEDCRHQMVEKVEVPICSQCGSYVKPDIVFFGEELPPRFQQLVGSDTDQADLLLVMGTSLMVMPVAGIPSWVSRDCPRILLNRERVGNFLRIQSRDVFFEGDCDDGVRDICRLAGWETMLDNRYRECR